jgi:hypothetical protein
MSYDDPDYVDLAGNFPAFAENIIYSYSMPGYLTDRIYQDDYGCGYIEGGDCLAVKEMIRDSLNITGTLLVNYIGHGSVDRWSGEEIITNADIQNLTNNDKLPVILSMTCLDGYWIYPGREGLIEELVRADSKGAVAGFSPTGLGVASGHDQLHQGFYDSLFLDGNWTLGVASQAAKLKLYATGMNYDLLHTFTIFGDPALKIGNPYQFDVDVDGNSKGGSIGDTVTYSITINNTANITDTFELTINDNEWPISISITTSFIGPLLPSSSMRVDLMVSVPVTAVPGSIDYANIRVVSQGDRSQYSDLEITTTAGSYSLFLPSIEN